MKAVNSDADIDALRVDNQPTIAGDGADHWTVLWRATDPEDGDHDIWRAISNGNSANASLTITVPNGGEKWKIGKKHIIEWEFTGNAGSDAMLELLQGARHVENRCERERQ